MASLLHSLASLSLQLKLKGNCLKDILISLKCYIISSKTLLSVLWLQQIYGCLSLMRCTKRNAWIHSRCYSLFIISAASIQYIIHTFVNFWFSCSVFSHDAHEHFPSTSYPWLVTYDPAYMRSWYQENQHPTNQSCRELTWAFNSPWHFSRDL